MDQPNPTITLTTNGYAPSQIAERVCKIGLANVKVRMVDSTAQSYQIASVHDEDLTDPVTLGRCAAVAGLSPEAFQHRFWPVGSNVMGTQSKGGAT